MSVLLGILVHITKINGELLIFLLLLLGMRHLDPFRLILDADLRRRLAKEFTVAGCRRRENDASHKPGGRYFAQKD